MSAGRLLLLFAGDGDARASDGWLELEDGAVTARGDSWVTAPADRPGAVRRKVVIVAPGQQVALHWIELPSLSPAQARAAARMTAAEISLDPVDRLHVALGARQADGFHPIAVVAADRMAGWLGEAQALALDPDHVVPEPMLIPPPEAGERHWALPHAIVARGPTSGYTVEPDLAALLDDDGVEPVDTATVESGLADLLDPPPLDLRQGAFARRRRWRIDWAQARRLAIVAGAILLATLAIQAALILRYAIAADRTEAEIETVARTVLPRATALPNPPAQLRERLADLRGGGLGYGTVAGLLFDAVRATPDVELGALQFDRDGTLTATILATGAPAIAALEARLDAAGLDADTAPPRSGGGRQISELTVRAR